MSAPDGGGSEAWEHITSYGGHANAAAACPAFGGDPHMV